jgi:hypothetical protein
VAPLCIKGMHPFLLLSLVLSLIAASRCWCSSPLDSQEGPLTEKPALRAFEVPHTAMGKQANENTAKFRAYDQPHQCLSLSISHFTDQFSYNCILVTDYRMLADEFQHVKRYTNLTTINQ